MFDIRLFRVETHMCLLHRVDKSITLHYRVTAEEFQKVYLPRRWDTSYDDRLKQAEIPRDAPPTEFDWRQHEAVTEVKNQVR